MTTADFFIVTVDADCGSVTIAVLLRISYCNASAHIAAVNHGLVRA